jgi:hypothetical protein
MIVIEGFSENPALWSACWRPTPPSSRAAAAISTSTAGQGPDGLGLLAFVRDFFAMTKRSLAAYVPARFR